MTTPAGPPHFIILGAQRCGTTSLYNYLIKHPGVAPAVCKEVHFFDLNFERGAGWYQTHFPSPPRGSVTGEASPYYLFHPHVPRRVSALVPWAKLIILLRNPVDRAYSHYHHEVRLGAESLPFEEAIDREEERLHGELDRMLADEHYYSFSHQHHSYLARGVYVEQLKAWASLFPAEQLLILRGEDLYRSPAEVLRTVTGFLGLPEWNPPGFRKYNDGSYPTMDGAMRLRLARYFAPHNQGLHHFLGTDLGWNT